MPAPANRRIVTEDDLVPYEDLLEVIDGAVYPVEGPEGVLLLAERGAVEPDPLNPDTVLITADGTSHSVPTLGVDGKLNDNVLPATVANKADLTNKIPAQNAGYVTTSGQQSGQAIPVAKPSGDARPGVWEYTHASGTGYLFHLLASGSFNAPAALIALGLDSTAGGSGLLVANKSKSIGITINQQSSISDAAAYGIKITGSSTLAPSIRLEQNVTDAAVSLQILSFGTPGTDQRSVYIGDPGGEAWAAFAADGRLEGRRELRVRETNGSTRTTIAVGENSAFAWGSTSGYTTALGKDRVTWYSPSGGGSLWSFAWVAGGSGMNLLTGGAGAFGAAPSTSVIAIKNAQIGFLGASAISRRAATADATDLNSAVALVNALKADLIAYGLKTA